MKRDSRTAVLAVLVANITIATFKFVVVAISGSAAMWSEGIHSSVDTAKPVMMLISIHRGRGYFGEAERSFRRGAERHSEMIPNWQ